MFIFSLLICTYTVLYIIWHVTGEIRIKYLVVSFLFSYSASRKEYISNFRSITFDSSFTQYPSSAYVIDAKNYLDFKPDYAANENQNTP